MYKTPTALRKVRSNRISSHASVPLVVTGTRRRPEVNKGSRARLMSCVASSQPFPCIRTNTRAWACCFSLCFNSDRIICFSRSQRVAKQYWEPSSPKADYQPNPAIPRLLAARSTWFSCSCFFARSNGLTVCFLSGVPLLRFVAGVGDFPNEKCSFSASANRSCVQSVQLASCHQL